MREDIGGYNINSIEVVAAFDVDSRKVGKTFKEAMLSEPNCTPLFVEKDKIPDGPIVMMGNVSDGIANHMIEYPEDEGFRISEQKCENIVEILIKRDVDILINHYAPNIFDFYNKKTFGLVSQFHNTPFPIFETQKRIAYNRVE